MNIFYTICLIVISSFSILAQSPTPQRTPSNTTRSNDALERQREEARRIKEYRDIPLEDLKKVTNTAISPVTRPMSSIVKLERSSEQSQRLLPNPLDLVKYDLFLKSGKTGVFKLFSDLNCDLKNVVNVSSDCENNIPFTWSYSFLRKDYGDKDFFDLRFKNERLVVDSFLAQNIIVSIGDVSLEEVGVDTNGMKFLSEFKPEVREKKIQEQFWLIANKIAANGFSYAKVATPKENTTYLIRVIAYRISNGNTLNIEKNGPRSEDERRLLFAGNDRTRRDKIIAFRIIRRDSDGSFTIIWKELIDKDSPKLKFEKVEQLTGVKE